MKIALSTSALLLAAACRVGGDVAPLPLVGTPPDVVAIWPEIVADPPSTSSTWFSGLGAALRARGYRVVADNVTRQLLAEVGMPTTLVDPVVAGRELQVDALLQLHVRAFDFSVVDGVLHEARWDLEWQLWSGRGDGRQWTCQHHGAFHRPDRAPDDPRRPLDQQTDARDIVPIGGHGGPGFRDVAELLAHLHRDAMLRLPNR